MEFYDYYAIDYSSARRKFLAAANHAKATVAHYTHPVEKGPTGESLSIDIAHLGNPKASRQLLAISGTHGQEGYAGSAVQIAWMLSGNDRSLPDDIGVLLIHGLNPYGFAHDTRTTENNVDLNRNFVDHSQPYPENAGYGELHPRLVVDDWTAAALRKADEAADAYRERHGPDAYFDTVARGQFTHPGGLIFGGNKREWSNLTLETIVREHLGSAEKVALIDWHTGIGDFGEPFFLCFNEDGSALQTRAAQWWGADRVLGQRPLGLARPNYQGLVFQGVETFLAGRPMAGAVVEFGTRGARGKHTLRLDLWLRFKAEKTSERTTMLRADMIDGLNPYAQDWRESTIRHGLDITRQALAGLETWVP